MYVNHVATFSVIHNKGSSYHSVFMYKVCLPMLFSGHINYVYPTENVSGRWYSIDRDNTLPLQSSQGQ